MPSRIRVRRVIVAEFVALLVAILAAAGCVSDLVVEDDVTPAPGATQPAGNGSTLTAEAACQALSEAETEARSRLGCGERSITCPAHVFLAGATPCASYDEGSVTACVDFMGKYGSCGEFSSRPCVVTLVADSCTAPAPPEAGGPDAGSDTGADGAGGPDARASDASEGGGGPDGSDGQAPDGSREGGPPDGAAPDAAAPDAAPPEGGATDAG